MLTLVLNTVYGYLWFTDTYEKPVALRQSQIQRLESDPQEAKSNEDQSRVIDENAQKLENDPQESKSNEDQSQVIDENAQQVQIHEKRDEENQRTILEANGMFNLIKLYTWCVSCAINNPD